MRWYVSHPFGIDLEAPMTWAYWLKQMQAIGLVIWLLSGCGPNAPAASPDYSKTPVLFVHGYGGNSGNWQKMIAYLVSLGYPHHYLYAVDIAPKDMANDQAAITILKPAAEWLLERAQSAARSAGRQDEAPRRLDIVSHSMGAVSSRWYASKLHPELVQTWIALAGANYGTNALCGFQDEAAQEMCPAFDTSKESAVQVTLNGTPGLHLDKTPFGLGTDRTGILSIPPDQLRNIVYFTVRIESDAWIKPEDSAILDGSGGVRVKIPWSMPVKETTPGNFLFTANVGHDALLEHPDLIRFVVALLNTRHGK